MLLARSLVVVALMLCEVSGCTALRSRSSETLSDTLKVREAVVAIDARRIVASQKALWIATSEGNLVRVSFRTLQPDRTIASAFDPNELRELWVQGGVLVVQTTCGVLTFDVEEGAALDRLQGQDCGASWMYRVDDELFMTMSDPLPPLEGWHHIDARTGLIKRGAAPQHDRRAVENGAFIDAQGTRHETASVLDATQVRGGTIHDERALVFSVPRVGLSRHDLTSPLTVQRLPGRAEATLPGSILIADFDAGDGFWIASQVPHAPAVFTRFDEGLVAHLAMVARSVGPLSRSNFAASSAGAAMIERLENGQTIVRAVSTIDESDSVR